VFRTRAWRDDIPRWEQEIKPSLIAEGKVLLQEDLARASGRGVDCTRAAGDRFRRANHVLAPPLQHDRAHSVGTCSCTRSRGRDVGRRILQALRGLSPVSAGAEPQLDAVRRAVRNEPEALSLLTSNRSPAAILEGLETTPTAAGAAVRAYLDVVGLRILGGYDIADGHAREHPDLLVKVMRAAVTGDQVAQQAEAEKAIARVRERVPAEHRVQFDELLAEAQLAYGVRDQRIFYGDGLGGGVARRAILAAGERLVARGRMKDATHVVDATLARSSLSSKARQGRVPRSSRSAFVFRLETRCHPHRHAWVSTIAASTS
jgi:pyruvate,water dikinase